MNIQIISQWIQVNEIRYLIVATTILGLMLCIKKAIGVSK